MIDRVINRKFVYEFDIKGFFNNVSIYKVMDMLQDRGLNDDLANRLQFLLMQCPENLDLFKTESPSDYDQLLGIRKAFVLGKVDDLMLKGFAQGMGEINPLDHH